MKIKYRSLILAALLTLAGSAQAQSSFGTSDPSPALECGEYQWPEVQSPCPEVQIKQKHDHTPMPQYRAQGWDTVVTHAQRTLVLSCMPYLPVQYFNGGYYVDQIPFDPPDTSFYLNYSGTDINTPNKVIVRMPISTDDNFAASTTYIPYPFYFFGLRKDYFRIGANGLVTFTNNFGDGTSCPWAYSAPLPWTPTTNGSPADASSGNFDRMHDAIYGVYEDTYPSPSVHGTTGDPHWGIYYGVLDSFPCRKIICSWNDVPQFSCTNLRCSYQIVCYEGSNIIEVHVKQRQVCTSWNSGNGIIGIQNATGLPQTNGGFGTSTVYVQNGSPAAFFPQGKNTFNTNLYETAYRFTPRGNTVVVSEWYRILDNGDTIVLTQDPTDTNGYFYPMERDVQAPSYPNCGTLTRAVVSPTRVSRYVYHLKFMNANNDWYNLYDTIVIGIDTANTLSVHPTSEPTTTHTMNICEGSTANLTLEYPYIQQADTVIYRVFRRSGGTDIELPTEQCITLGEWTTDQTSHRQPITLLANLPTEGRRNNKIDSIYIQTSIDFTNGSTNYSSMLVGIYPNFDTTTVQGICQGERYTWSANGQVYTTTTQATVNLTSTPGCDSTVHLDLTVMNTSYTVDHIYDCKPYTWINGQTYYTSNTATAILDTVLLQNMWGCDSVVQLDLSIQPVTANIKASRDFFDFDNLDVVLNDISTGSDSRVWQMPNGLTYTSATAFYTMPADLDEADIWLLAASPYGCVDSTHIVIPLRKESFWVPNAFTPDNANGNNIFSSISTHTLTEEMMIFNRNGQMVFKCEGADCPWNGRDLDGNPCPQGVYTYLIRYSNEYTPKRTNVLRGTVTLIR